jgi:hypothetical protein
MNPTILDERVKLPSILTVYQPIEEYWRSFGLGRSLGTDPGAFLDPFDALLVHLVLEFSPGLPLLIDMAAGSTAGASSLIGLAHPHVRRVIAVTEDGTAEPARSLPALRAYIRLRIPGPAPLDIIPVESLADSLSEQEQVVILADASRSDPTTLARRVESWLDEAPGALVLLLGLDRVGECPAIDRLLRLCGPGSTNQFWLIRELGEFLAASRLGLVARRDHPHANDILLRLQLQYNGNFGFIDLMKTVNHAAMQSARVDDEVVLVHPSTRHIKVEIETLRQAARESNERADAALRSLAALTAERDELRWIVPTPLPTILRYKLSPGILGKLYRGSKRAARKCLRPIG